MKCEQRRLFVLTYCLLLAILLLPACGPNVKLVRQYMANSPHRSVAVLPFDLAAGQKNLSEPTADLMENKMRRLGFIVADRQKVRPLYGHSKIKNHAYDSLSDTADLGRQLGVQAVLAGSIDEAYERVEKRPPEYEIITNPIPACCTRPNNPCSSRLVFDPLAQAYVDSCGPTHRKIQIAPGFTARIAAFSVRVRLVDVNTKNPIWESAQQMQPVNQTTYNAADQATDSLADRLIEDFMKQSL